VTTLVHGAAECGKAVAASRALFGHGDLRALDEKTLAAALAEVPVTKVPACPPAGTLVTGTSASAAGNRRGRSLPEQRQGHRRRRGAAASRPAARTVPGAAARQAHRGRRRGDQG